ncbi:hypothetical protein ACE1MK_07345 [Tenacibaculum maritimum]|uniref:hypothetical protein n=1 Tax=Tenacibaculum maritimum TaxID=107401 RepID=UPI00132FA7EB|nr:hypothetical protein [Tenacibaculum maritimum]
MKATSLLIFKYELIKEPYYFLQIEGIGYVEIARSEAKKFKNKLKYEETIINKSRGFIARDYKII